MTAAVEAKAAGLKSLRQVSEMTGRSVSTLRYWFIHDRGLFNIVLAGCVVELNKEVSA